MEAQEPISDLVGVFLTEDIGCPDRLLFTEGIKNDEATPSLILAEQVQGSPPSSTIQLHTPRLHRHGRR